jgi:hypothetical protein
VNLLGIDSVRVPNARRREIWTRIATDLPFDLLGEMIQVAALEKCSILARKFSRVRCGAAS